MSSSQVPIPAEAPRVPVETYGEKFKRKFMQQPLVPIGAALTIFTLTAAGVRMRQGRARDMNHWLRARVLAQGFTIVAIVAGSYMFGQNQDAAAEKANKEQDALIERAAFEARMRAAEEAHEIETVQKTAAEKRKGGGGSGWLGWGSRATKEKESAKEAAAPTVAASTVVTGGPSVPAPTEAKAEGSGSKSILERLGLSGSNKS